jgi:cysteine desulfurase
MQPYLGLEFGNPAAITKLGVTAKSALEKARTMVAEVLEAHLDEIIFTSGGTESTNLAIQGIMRRLTRFANTTSEVNGYLLGGGVRETRQSPIRSGFAGHLITSAIEHHAVLEPANLLVQQGYELTTISVAASGIVEVEKVLAAIRPETRLISVMLANNEIGTFQPVAELARALRRVNRDRSAKALSKIYLHTDACQAAAYLSLAVGRLGVDALSLNSAKVGGPKGMGLLYLRRGTPFTPLIVGGGQESGRRAGTENVAAIVGGSLAVSLAQSSWQDESQRLQKLRERLFELLKKSLPEIILNGDPDCRLPNNLNLTLPGIDAEALVLYLDADGVTIGTGAACSNLTLEPSHVLLAIGLTTEAALATIRLTLGWNITKPDIDEAGRRIIDRIAWLRQRRSPDRRWKIK